MLEKIKIVLVDAYPGVLPGLGLGYLAGALRQEFTEDEIEIKILQRKFEENFLNSILFEKPNIVGYISFTPGMNYLLGLIKEVAAKNSAIIQVIGGPHITAMPTSLPEEVDVGAIGPGEKTICRLVRIYQKKGDLPVVDLRLVPGIVFRDNNELVKTGKADFYDNFDDVPKPARDLLNIKGFFPMIKGPFPLKFYRSSGVMTSRGCPFNCIFCQEDVFNKYRYHSAERAVAEIEELVERYQVNFVEIMDDQFAIDLKRLADIVVGIEKKKLNKKAIFFCYLRADQVSDEVLVLIKRMNVKIVFIGFESGSDKILQYLKQQSCSVTINQRAYDLCRKYGILVYGSFIFGSPRETLADMGMTLDFIRRNKMALTEVQTLTPLPGTRIWDYAKTKGLVSETMNWDNLLLRIKGDGKDQPWLCENVSYEDFFNFYKLKVEPVTWHYKQIIKDFNAFDFLKFKFWRLFIQQPKNCLSMLKHTSMDWLNFKKLKLKKGSKENIKILLLTQMFSNTEVSGGVRTTWDYAQKLARQGVSVYVLANNIRVDQSIKHINLKVFKVPFSRFGHELVKDDTLKSFFYGIYFLFRYRIDIIHAVPVQAVCPFSKFKFGRKFVGDAERTWAYEDKRCITDLLIDRQRKSPDFGTFNTFQKIFLRFSRFFYWLFNLNEEFPSGANALFCRSKSTMDYLKSMGIKSKLFYVPIGINLNEFNYTNNDLITKERKKIIFLNTGSLAYRKGTHYLIQAYKKFAHKFPGISELWLVGVAEPETLSDFKEMSKNDSAIKFFNSVMPSKIINYITACDIYLSASLIGEYGPVQPNCLEAMAMAKPIIITEYGSTRDWPDKDIALTCKLADTESLFEAMERLFLDESLRKKIGDNACQYVKENFSWEVIVRNAINYYKKILKEDENRF